MSEKLQHLTFLLLQIKSFSREGSNQSLGANKLELVSSHRSSLNEKHQRLEDEPNQNQIAAAHHRTERPPSQKAIPRSVSYSSSRIEWNTTLASDKGNYCQAQSAPQFN